jgi:glycosyltransferase involved in cell wall biosynthesis
LLYCIGQLHCGGAERQLYYLLGALDRNRYKPAVVVWNFNETDVYVPQIRRLGITLYPLPLASSAGARLREFRRLVAEIKPEVVHSYSFYTNVAVWWATLGTKSIPIGSIRGDFVTERRASGVVGGHLSACLPATQICNSQAAKEVVKQSRWIPKPTQIYLVRNGLDMSRFKYSPLPQQKPRLIAVGRLDRQKRWDRFLNILAKVAARGLNFSARLVGEGPLRAELGLQARRLGLTELVEFMGLQDNVPALVEDSTLLVHTADAEGCPNVVMEAMACGRAVVATDAGDIPYLVEDGKTGFVTRRGDDASLAEAIEKLIIDRNLCDRMGEAGRIKSEREFGLDRLASETLATYQTIGWRNG